MTDVEPMPHLDLDTALTVLANPMRREILSRLVQETHYPLQLARELNTSQQAVMKHLSVLEKHGFVKSKPLPSDSGGPPRKCYTATTPLSIRIDMGPNLFNATLRLYDEETALARLSEHSDLEAEYRRVDAIKEPHERLKAISA